MDYIVYFLAHVSRLFFLSIFKTSVSNLHCFDFLTNLYVAFIGFT